MNESITNRIKEAGVIAVVVLDDLQSAIPLAKSLLTGGVNAIELTLRTPVALDAARLIKESLPEMLLGIGTVLTADHVRSVVDIGVDFAVSPGCNPKIISEAKKFGLSFSPGIMTPSDIEIALENGCRNLKFFPAETSGGLKHLESMANPYEHLGLQFIPLGGVKLSNAKSYLSSPLISAIGGSWVAQRKLIQNKDWEQIGQNAKEIRSLINQVKEEK